MKISERPTMDLLNGIILSLTAGAPLINNRNAQSRAHDGTTSTFVILMVGLSFTFVLIETVSLPSEHFFKIEEIYVIIGCILTCGSLACLGNFILSHMRGLSAVTEKIDKPTILKEFFLWLFGIPSVTFCGMNAYNLIHCNSVEGFSGLRDSEIYYYVMTVVFIFVEMIFMSYFYAFKLNPSLLSNITLFFLVIGNLSIWFQSTLQEVSHVPTNYVNNSKELNCVHNSTTAELVKKVHPFVSPVFLECLLLATTLASDIISTSQMINRDYRVLPEAEAQSETSFICSSESQRQYTTLSTQNDNRPIRKTPFLFYILLIFFFINGAVAFVGYLLQVTYLPSNVRIHQLIGSVEVIVKLLMLGSTVFAFVRLNLETTTDAAFIPVLHGRFVLVFSSCSNFIIHIIGIFGNIYSQDYTHVVRNTVTILQDYLQLTFLLHVDRCQKTDNQTRKNYIKYACYLLVATNFGCWLNDSVFLFQFKGSYFNKSTLQHKLYGYKIINDVIRPMAVYYRFLCGCAFYTLCKAKFAND